MAGGTNVTAVGSSAIGAERLAWGILGTGRIAGTFAKALPASASGHLLAVGSRSIESARRFAAEHGATRSYGSYEEILADPDVRAVYISLPNHLHATWTLRCAEAGKHVLCEKPLASNLGEAMIAVEAARANGVFLMEAFMYRCHPQTAKLAEILRARTIGDVRQIQVNFAFNMGGAHPENIRQQNNSAGGGLMDVGCYCASLARLVAGASVGQDFADPTDVKAIGHIGAESRIDEWTSAVLRFRGDIVATLTCGIQVAVDSTLRIWGSEGQILVPQPWFPGRDSVAQIVVARAGQEPETVSVEADRPLYALEADTVASAIAEGRTQAQSPAMTWADSLGNMRTLDAWRRELGLVFDNERPAALAARVSGRPLAVRSDPSMKFGPVEGLDKLVSRVGIGSMVFNQGLPLTCALLDYFVEHGGNCIDTAYAYRTESMVGEWLRLRGNRYDVVLIAKGAHTPDCNPQALTRQLFESLDKLQTDFVDLYFMHRDNLDIPVGEFVDCLNEHHRAGRIRAFGGSNWTTQRIDEANEYARKRGLVPFTASSPNFALALWNEPMWAGCVAATDPASRAWYAERQMPIFAWSSQASGLFTGRYRPEDRDDPSIAAIVRTWYNTGNFGRLARARTLADQRGVSSSEIALAYVLCQPFPVFALIGPRTIEEARESLGALSIALSSDEMRWLENGG
jgi:predicted dehydrogenase/aryl-alcohol dehydrogenase-like predicted oxidoreductase